MIERYRLSLRDAVSDHWSSIDDPNREVYWAFIDAICDQALQSLSQEAVRDEALEEAAKCAENVYGGFTANIRTSEFEQELVRDAYGPWVLNAEIAVAIRALKREPNAAGQVQAAPKSDQAANSPASEPAPAAPVAEMVRRLEDYAKHMEGNTEFPYGAGDLCRAAALLAKLGQGGFR